MSRITEAQVNALANKALQLIKETDGAYICKCLFVNGVFSLLLEKSGVSNKLVSGRMAGGFNSGDDDSFRYGYAKSQGRNLIDHHVWCESSSGQIYDAMMLVMDEEMKLTSTSTLGEFLLPKTSVISTDIIKSYQAIMDDYQIGIHYEKVDSWHRETMRLIDKFVAEHQSLIRKLIASV